MEGESVTISVCVGSSCHLKGSRQIIERLQFLITEHGLTDGVELKASLCMDNCMNGVCVTLDDTLYSLMPEDVEAFFKAKLLPDTCC